MHIVASTIDHLERTPAVLKAMLAHLPEELLRRNEGGDSFSPVDVVGHLAHGEETDWIPRIAKILECDVNTEFEIFERFAHREIYANADCGLLLETFAQLRSANITTLYTFSITEEQLTWTGVHPEFGSVTLRQLLAAWTVHDLGHIAQIARVLAKQYTADVGPWHAYLPVLRPRA